MKPKDWFTLVLRGVGVWHFLFAIEYLVSAFCVRAGFYRTSTGSFEFYLITTLVHLIASLVLLGFAPSIARLFYRGGPSSDE